MVAKVYGWTAGVAIAGALVASKGAEIWKPLAVGALIGAVIGFGLGKMIVAGVARRAIAYWTFTFGFIGAVVAMADPITIRHVAKCVVIGVVLGYSIGAVRYWWLKRNSEPSAQT